MYTDRASQDACTVSAIADGQLSPAGFACRLELPFMARDIYSLQLHYFVGSQPGMNVLHFAEDTEATTNPDVNAQGCIAGFITSIQDLWMACIPSSVLLVGYKARRVNNGGGPTVIQPVGGIPGTTGAEFSAGAIGPCIIWSYQKITTGWAAGRTFLPAVGESMIANNVFDTTLISNIQDVIEALLTVPCFGTSTPPLSFEFGIYSPTHASFSGAEAGTVSGKPGVQNRRLKPGF